MKANGEQTDITGVGQFAKNSFHAQTFIIKQTKTDMMPLLS